MSSVAERTDDLTFTPDQLVSSSTMGKNFGTYLKKARQKPLLVLRNNHIDAVLLSFDDYRELVRDQAAAEELYLIAMATRRTVEMLMGTKAPVPMASLVAKFGLADPGEFDPDLPDAGENDLES